MAEPIQNSSDGLIVKTNPASKADTAYPNEPQARADHTDS